MWLYINGGPTDLDPLRTNLKDSHHAADEGSDSPEVKTSDTPGAVHQQHNVSLCSGPAHNIWNGRRKKGFRMEQVREFQIRCAEPQRKKKKNLVG